MTTALKPYLIRSVYEWIVDNKHTPYLLVNAENEEAILPVDFINEGKIILNISLQATDGLELGNDKIEFEARFSGEPTYVMVPINAVLALYMKEGGQGMVFSPNNDGGIPTPPTTPKPKKKSPRPQLRVVK